MILNSIDSMEEVDDTVEYQGVWERFLRRYRILEYSTVQYSTVQYSTVQYSTVQYSTVPSQS